MNRLLSPRIVEPCNRISKSICRPDNCRPAWRGRVCRSHRHTADRWWSPSGPDERTRICRSAVAAAAVALETSVLALESPFSSLLYRRTWRQAGWLHERSVILNPSGRRLKSRSPRTRLPPAEGRLSSRTSSPIRACSKEKQFDLNVCATYRIFLLLSRALYFNEKFFSRPENDFSLARR